ncbi:unnamed protein product [Candidula unifasciata]|uniref:G-protein coupled receptors family 2 profile 2 domain-containing protein n=1 Tax=Candidula unifasciata TaxID=100452 RepID=A0A8S3Z683_9EUPU|nr:unnamed protein product [Candidula unifasciata]
MVHDTGNQGNFTSFTTANFGAYYCSARCYANLLLFVQPLERCFRAQVTCYPCDCIKPQCEIYGTCCPVMSSLEERIADISAWQIWSAPPYHNHVHKTLPRNETQHRNKTQPRKHPQSPHTQSFQEAPGKRQVQKPPKHTRMGCDDRSLQGFSFLYLRSCPLSFTDQHIRRLCEEDLAEHEQSPTAWTMSVKCENYLRVYSATTKDELIQLSFRQDSLCSIRQQFPAELVPHKCDSQWHGEVLESCNETGQWSAANPDIAAQCENMSDISQRVRVYQENTTFRYYKNIFCAICNSDSNFLDDYLCNLQHEFRGCCYRASTSDLVTVYPGPPERKMVLPFSLLLGSLHGKHKPPLESGKKFKDCHVTEWSSPDGTCLPLQCTRGKFFEGGNCTTAIQDINGLGYRARVVYLPKDIKYINLSQINSTEMLNSFMTYLQEQHIFSPDISETEITAYFIWEEMISLDTNTGRSPITSDRIFNNKIRNVTQQLSTDHSRFFFYVDTYIIANKSLTRDLFEAAYLRTFLANTSEIQITENLTVMMAPKILPQLRDLSGNSCLFSEEKSDMQTTANALMSIKTMLNNTMWNYKEEFIFSSLVLTCVHVSFNKSYYNISVNCSDFPPTWQIKLKLGEIVLTFSDLSDTNRLAVEDDNRNSEGRIFVCQDLLEETILKLKDNSYNSYKSEIELWLYYLTHICIGLSLLTLLITLVVYLLCVSLRNEAGINNMFLSGTLFLAQASLLASSHVEGPNSLCIIVGISTHFLWLSMITWSFICCFHMFRVFTTKTGISKCTSTSQRNKRIKKAIIGVIVPALIVVLVVISTYFTSAGQRIGYTDTYPCYLDSSLLAIVSLVTPLGAVTLANIYFFASTVQQIQKVKKLQAHQDFNQKESQNFIIYIKLSSLTGAFWTMAIVSEYTDNDPLRFIAIILNGLQGVFLFLSFVCTKRVTKLFFQILQQENCSPITNISKSTKESKDKTLEKSSTM